MRLMIKTMLALLVVAAIIPFSLPLKDGKPLLKWSDIKMPGAPKLPDMPDLPSFGSSDPQANASKPVTTYKWQDAEGNWNIGDTPPSNSSYETIIVDPNTNLIQATKPPVVMATPSPEPTKKESAVPAYSPSMAYNPEKVTEIMDSARNVDTLLQQRKEQQDKMLQAIQ